MLEMKYWMDEFYMWVAKKIVYGGSLIMNRFDSKVIDGAVNGVSSGGIALGKATDRFDMQGVDGMVNGMSKGSFAGGRFLWKMQSGRVQDYASIMILGLIGLILIMMLGGAL